MIQPLSTTSPSSDTRDVRIGWAVLAAVATALVVAGWMCLPLMRTWAVSGSLADSSPDADQRVKDALTKFKLGLDSSRAQLHGRSLFFVPPAPPPPRPVDSGPREPLPDSAPTSYGGPAIVYVVNDAVYLADGSRLTAEEPEHAGVRLVSLNAPWSARLEWRGKEFDVEIFARNQVVVPSSTETAAPPAGTPPTVSPSNTSTPESL